jgi:hypothetical protein
MNDTATVFNGSKTGRIKLQVNTKKTTGKYENPSGLNQVQSLDKKRNDVGAADGLRHEPDASCPML